MTATAYLVADDVAAAFAAGYGADPRTVTQDIDVRRVQVIDFGDLEKLTEWDHDSKPAKAIIVFVKANQEKPSLTKRAPRGFVEMDYPIQIAIAAKLKTAKGTAGLLDVEPMAHLSQELRDWFYARGRNLPTREEAIEGEPQILFDADPDSLRESSLFLSEFILTFTGSRPR